MIKKLQKRFIGVSLLAVAILMLLILIPFNIIFHYQTEKGFDETLSYIMQYGGMITAEEMTETEGETEAAADSAAEVQSMAPGAAATKDQPENETAAAATEAQSQSWTSGSTYLRSVSSSESGKSYTQIRRENAQSWLSSFLRGLLLDEGSITINPETQYRTRYFLITIDREGEVTAFSLTHIAAVSEEQAETIARNRLRVGKSHGIVHYADASYYFKMIQTDDGETQIGFLECTPELSSERDVRNISILIGVTAILLFLIIIWLLSKRAIRPYIENAEAQKQFITNAGHELKTPLAIISANTEVIEMMDGKSEWTDSIMTQVNRSTELISQLIALSKMEEAEKIQLTDVDISAAVKESARSFEPVITRQQKTLETDIAENLTAKAEPKILMELVNILIDNAQKYCDDGGKIRVVLKKRGKSGVLLTVSNDYQDGAGVDYSRFFRRFYRGDTSHNSKKAGHGIGLSMASTIVERLGGSISASWKGGVISFTVSL